MITVSEDCFLRANNYNLGFSLVQSRAQFTLVLNFHQSKNCVENWYDSEKVWIRYITYIMILAKKHFSTSLGNLKRQQIKVFKGPCEMSMIYKKI